MAGNRNVNYLTNDQINGLRLFDDDVINLNHKNLMEVVQERLFIIFKYCAQTW